MQPPIAVHVCGIQKHLDGGAGIAVSGTFPLLDTGWRNPDGVVGMKSIEIAHQQVRLGGQWR